MDQSNNLKNLEELDNKSDDKVSFNDERKSLLVDNEIKDMCDNKNKILEELNKKFNSFSIKK